MNVLIKLHELQSFAKHRLARATPESYKLALRCDDEHLSMHVIASSIGTTGGWETNGCSVDVECRPANNGKVALRVMVTGTVCGDIDTMRPRLAALAQLERLAVAFRERTSGQEFEV